MPEIIKNKLPLWESDLANLRESGLTYETIRANQLRTENGALVFPYRDLDGGVNCFARRRPHGGKPAKYLQPPGTAVRAYFPDGSLKKLRDCKSPIYFTEGEKKAMALSQLNLAAVGLGGVWCGCKPKSTELIDDLRPIVWANRMVYIVFDADAKSKTRQDVDKARRRLAGALRGAGAKVHQVQLPVSEDKVGVDDFLVANGPDAFHELVKRATSKAEQTRFTAAQLMAMELPEPRCVVPGIVAEGLNLLVSRPKLGKSWFAYALSVAVASGGQFLGHVIDQGDVLYLAMEDNVRRLQSRLKKLIGNVPPPERLHLAIAWPRADDGGLEEIQKWIDGAEDPRLVIVDTLAKMKKRPTKQSDRYAEDYTDIGQLKELADENEVALLLIHHDRKAQGDDILDDVSGTIGITGAADTILLLKRERGRHDACLHVTGRDVDEQEIALGWDADACRWSVLGDAKELRMSDERQQILGVVSQANGEPVKRKDIAEALEKKSTNIGFLLNKMTADGTLKSGKDGYVIGDTIRDAVKRLPPSPQRIANTANTLALRTPRSKEP